MKLRVLDLDGSIVPQDMLFASYPAQIWACEHWGPRIRLACSFRRFSRFEDELHRWLESEGNNGLTVSLYGSGDFHHVSLSLIRRITTPINLLVIDNHPDWMRGVPFLHCGTWLYHAMRLPHVKRIFHIGGDVDFDNYYQGLAPWSLLRAGKLSVIPAVRTFERGAWRDVPNEPFRPLGRDRWEPRERINELIGAFRRELSARPIYISLDKDVMRAETAPVNWDSGHLTLDEVQTILAGFLAAAEGKLAGMDIVGDWSRVKLRGVLSRVMHLTMHPTHSVDAYAATRRNEKTNLALLQCAESALNQTWKRGA